MFEPDESHRKVESGKSHAREAARELTEAATDAADELRRAVQERGGQWRDEATDYIEKHPLQALAFAGLVGLVLGLLTSRRTGCQFRRTQKDPFD